MQLLQKSTYSQSQNVDANPTKHLEASTSEYLHASFLLWEYKNHYSKKEYRQLLQDYAWDKGAAEEKRALKIAEHFQNFSYRPQDLFQIPVTTLLKLCSDKYKPIIEQLSNTEEDIDCAYVDSLIKSRAAQLKKEKESQIPQKPSIWKRNCRQERYVAFPPLYEDDQQTGVLTQKLMDEFGLIPQDILRRAIADLYQKIADEKGQPEGNAAQDVDIVDVRENNDNDYTQPQPNQEQTVEDKWQELNQQLKTVINSNGEVSQEIGRLIFESCQNWEATVPTDKRWSAIANIAAHNEKFLKHLSDYANGNHSEWRDSWGAMLANSDNFSQEIEWVPSAIRIDALIAMGYKIPATVEVTAGDYEGEQGRIVELIGDTSTPILVECDDFQEYFHWNELEIIAEAQTFNRYNTDEFQENEYLEEPEESDIKLEPTPLDKAIDALINGDWKDIRDVFNEHPEIKEEAWNALSSEQKRRVVDITPETVKVLNQAKKDGVIQEYKEIAVGVYQIKLPSTILWEQRAFHEIEIRHYLKGWREAMEKK